MEGDKEGRAGEKGSERMGVYKRKGVIWGQMNRHSAERPPLTDPVFSLSCAVVRADICVTFLYCGMFDL